MRFYMNTIIFRHSTVEFQERRNTFKIMFAKHLQFYYEVNGRYPTNVLVFRDGVGDGQLKHCRDFEITQFENCLESCSLNIKLTFVVIQKRINTKVFLNKSISDYENPPPATIMDNTLTRRNW